MLFLWFNILIGQKKLECIYDKKIQFFGSPEHFGFCIMCFFPLRRQNKPKRCTYAMILFNDCSQVLHTMLRNYSRSINARILDMTILCYGIGSYNYAIHAHVIQGSRVYWQTRLEFLQLSTPIHKISDITQM